MLNSPSNVEKKVINWLQGYAKSAGKESWFISPHFSKDKTNQLIHHLCRKTGLPTYSNDVDGIHLDSHNILYYAEEHRGLIICTFTREYLFFRLYSKDWFLGDIFPFGDLSMSEIGQLYTHVFGEDFKLPLEHLHERPYSDYIWGMEEEDRYGVITSEEDPTKSRHWGRYTVNQRQLIAMLYQREKLTRHKAVRDIPACKLRNIPGLVR